MSPEGRKSDSLVRTLIVDVESALSRIGSTNTEADRREAIRTTFAAIEGVAWLYREHIRSVANTISSLPSITDLALQEKTYSIGDTGQLTEQTRFVPLTAMIRFTTRVAQETFCDFEADFGGEGWLQLRTALAKRNRLVHPKLPEDLTTNLSDVETAKAGFFWLCELASRGMAAANVSFVLFNEDARDLTDKLKAGDEQTLAAYREVLSRQD